MQAHTCSYEVSHCAFVVFHLLVILQSSCLFCLVLLFTFSFDIIKQTHLVSSYLRPHMGSVHSSNTRTALDQFFTAHIQSSYISIFLPLCMPLCSVFLQVYFTYIVVTNTVFQCDVQSKGLEKNEENQRGEVQLQLCKQTVS